MTLKFEEIPINEVFKFSFDCYCNACYTRLFIKIGYNSFKCNKCYFQFKTTYISYQVTFCIVKTILL